MKTRALFLSIAALLIFSFTKTSFASDVKHCIPTSFVWEVPDESATGWVKLKHAEIEGTHEDWQEKSVIGARTHYVHSNGTTLGVFSFFGKVGFKAWACGRGADDTPVTGERPDHMIAVFQQDGTWVVRNTPSPRVELLYDNQGNPNAVVIELDGIQTIIEK